MNSHRTIVVLILVGFAPLLAGCGGKSVDRLPVHGTVVLPNGDKLSGSISFLPANGRTGPAATTKLAEGSYRFDRSNGPTAGLQTVIVKKVVPRATTLKSLADQKAIAKTQTQRVRSADQKAVANTKTQWTLSADVPDDGQYLHDFTLEN